MCDLRSRPLLFALLVLSSTSAAAQDPAAIDSGRAQIRTTLRAFYFNLAHQDWEALTADILAAKVVAHRPLPKSLAMAAMARGGATTAPVAADPKQCPRGSAALVDRAIVTLDAVWAEVLVPHCTPISVGVDQFRLIRFENRWRFVSIELFQDPVIISSDR
jgi:hypothetical protein